MFAKCRVIQDPNIEKRVKQRYDGQIEQLLQEGFQYAGLMETDHSLPLLPFVAFCTFAGQEIATVRGLRVQWYHPLFRSKDAETIAYPLGIATRFYTFFADKTIQRTTSNSEGHKHIPNRKIFVDGVPGDQIGEAWLHHLANCEQRIAAGKSPIALQGFDEVLEAQIREDAPVTTLATALVSWAITSFFAWKAIAMFNLTS